MSNAFKPGDLVICIDDSWNGNNPANPRLNQVLSIQNIECGFLKFKAIEGSVYATRMFRLATAEDKFRHEFIERVNQKST